jgi:hypothetical protein
MAQGLELSIIISGQGTAVKPIDDTTQSLDRLRGTTKKGREEFALSNRRSAAFASEGLSQVAQVSPRLSGAIAELAEKSKVASVALQGLGAAFLGVEAFKLGFQIGETIRDFIELGEFADSYIARLEKGVAEERKFQDALAQRGRISREFRRSIIEDESAVTQLRLRNSGLDVEATEEQFKSRMKLIELAKRERDVEVASLSAKGIDVTKLKAETEQKFQAERTRLAYEAGARIDEINQQNADKAIKAESQLLEASNSRRQAELATQQITLEGEGRIAEVIRVQTAQRLLTIQTEAQKRRELIVQQVKDQREAEGLKVQLVQETTEKIKVALEQEKQARRAAIAEAAGAAGRTPGASRVPEGFGAVEQLKRDAQLQAQGFAELQKAGVPVRDLWQEMQRTSEGLATRVQTLRGQFADTPAVLDWWRRICATWISAASRLRWARPSRRCVGRRARRRAAPRSWRHSPRSSPAWGRLPHYRRQYI